MRSLTAVAAVAMGLVGCQNSDFLSNFTSPLGGGGRAAISIAVGDTAGSATPVFKPAVDTVPTGDTIGWVVNSGAGDAPFTVTWDQSPPGATVPPNSGDLQAGQTFNVVFSQAGWYSYHCTHHPNMAGSIYVLRPAGAGPLRASQTTDPH
jgi:plastocyanin